MDEDDLQVRTHVPPAVDGLPSAGTTDYVSCWVTSSEDTALNVSIDPVDIEVLALNRYSAQLTDESGNLIDVLSETEFTLITENGSTSLLELSNLGNTAQRYPYLYKHNLILGQSRCNMTTKFQASNDSSRTPGWWKCEHPDNRGCL